jgi:ATP-dependent Lon protease
MSEQTTQTTAGAQTDLPLIVLDGAVVFPYTVMTLPVDEDTAAAAEAVAHGGRLVLLVARREDADADAPLSLQLHRVGVVARIEQFGTLPNGASGIVVRGLVRAIIGEQTQVAPYPRFAFAERPDTFDSTPELEQLTTEARAAIDAVIVGRELPQEIRNFVRSIDHPGHLADNTGYSPDYTFGERQELLETFDLTERLRKVRDFYNKQFNLIEVQARLREEVQGSAAKQQREFYLRQQMRAIQKSWARTTTRPPSWTICARSCSPLSCPRRRVKRPIARFPGWRA